MNSEKRFNSTKLLSSAALAVVIVSSSALGSFSQEEADPAHLKERCESAQRLIEEGRMFIEQAGSLHKRMESQILEAHRLKGEAEILQTIAPATSPQKLSPKEKQEAQAQYRADLEKFRDHAAQYGAHARNFESEVGACRQSEANYQALVKNYQLHCEQFHLPNIPPPHICLNLDLSYGEASSLAFLLRSDRRRIAEAEQELHKEESRLARSQREAPYLESSLRNDTARQKREQDLAEEFARLKKEYDLLTIERQQLNGVSFSSGNKVIRSSISGKVKNK